MVTMIILNIYNTKEYRYTMVDMDYTSMAQITYVSVVTLCFHICSDLPVPLTVSSWILIVRYILLENHKNTITKGSV